MKKEAKIGPRFWNHSRKQVRQLHKPEQNEAGSVWGMSALGVPRSNSVRKDSRTVQLNRLANEVASAAAALPRPEQEAHHLGDHGAEGDATPELALVASGGAKMRDILAQHGFNTLEEQARTLRAVARHNRSTERISRQNGRY